MADTDMQVGLSAKVVSTTEQPFKPGNAVQLEFELEPIAEEAETIYPADYYSYYNTLVPPSISQYTSLPTYSAPKQGLIVNIETTGAKPWEARIICIGVLDPNEEQPQAYNFIKPTELEIMDEFVTWLEESPYTLLIGYNVAFDYRFLYAVMQRYRIEAPRFMAMALYDLMQQQEQVKSAFVYGNNPSGKLDEWAYYLLGVQPPATQEDVFAWYKAGEVDKIADYNSYKLTVSYYLYTLDLLVKGAVPVSSVIARVTTEESLTPKGIQSGSPESGNGNIDIQCPTCRQKQEMPKGDKVINCFVCGTPISNPSLKPIG